MKARQAKSHHQSVWLFGVSDHFVGQIWIVFEGPKKGFKGHSLADLLSLKKRRQETHAYLSGYLIPRRAATSYLRESNLLAATVSHSVRLTAGLGLAVIDFEGLPTGLADEYVHIASLTIAL
jgi:hypothetical protein